MCCGWVQADDASNASLSMLISNSDTSTIASASDLAIDRDRDAEGKVASTEIKPPPFSFLPDADLDSPSNRLVSRTSANHAAAAGTAVNRVSDVPPCCVPPWVHRSGIFGEAMLLRARNSDTAYAALVDGAVPAGRTGVLDSEFDFGYRVGLVKAFDRCHSIVATYTGFISENDDAISGTAIDKLLIHPDALNAASNALMASGRTALDFHIFDLDYRFLLHGSDSTAINMLIGARYTHMEQEVDTIYQTVGDVDSVSSNVDFDGAGLRLGLDAEHHIRHGLYAYGRANASFLAGEFDATYLNTQSGAYVSSADFNTARLVTILDLEVGAGWQASQNCRFSAGYLVSGWFNSVTNADWIDGVRDNNNHFADMSQAITLDGFHIRGQWWF